MKPVHATARAAALLIGSVPALTLGAPQTCADVLRKIEKRMSDAGVQQPQLKIVPKGLSATSQVVASCENGTQHIVLRPPAAASTPVGKPAEKPDRTRTKR